MQGTGILIVWADRIIESFIITRNLNIHSQAGRNDFPITTKGGWRLSSLFPPRWDFTSLWYSHTPVARSAV